MTYKLITSKNVTNIFDGKSDRESGREDECMIRGNKKIQKETEDEKKARRWKAWHYQKWSSRRFVVVVLRKK